MINNNELRIGNWASIGEYQDVQINRIDENPNAYDPIPLTPEILEKSGFVKRFADSECNIWDLKDTEWQKHITLALVDAGWKYLSAPGANPFHNVHQLQNLYFCLCGQELDIKL